MSLDLRIILDKSVVHGLSNQEIDSLDQYFFQIIPPILLNEILAGLTKEYEENRISSAAYRISGNGGLAFKYLEILGQSLIGTEIPMDGNFVPAGEQMVRSNDGSIGTIIDTSREEEIIFRWERKEFLESEKLWALKWRRLYERPINFKMYTDKIAEAGLHFKIPKNDSELVEITDWLLNEKKFQSKILFLLAKEFKLPLDFQKKVIKRWFKEGKPMIKDFAPYAFFCSKANFLWAIGLTNSNLFSYNKNDRKDLEYCYYLPHCEIFASNDRKHKRLVPFLLRSDQSFVGGNLLKDDLKRLSEEWEKLSKEERVEYRHERGFAPPENENSIVFKLWKKHKGSLSPPVIDVNLNTGFGDFIRAEYKKLKSSEKLSSKEIEILQDKHKENNPSSFIIHESRMDKSRIIKLYPQLKMSDLDEPDVEN